MKKVRTEIIINASIETIWELISLSEESLKHIYPNVVYLNPSNNNSNDSNALNGKEYVVGIKDSKTDEIEEQLLIIKNISEHDAYKVLEWQQISQGKYSFNVIYELEKIDSKKTRLVYVTVIEFLSLKEKLTSFFVNSKWEEKSEEEIKIIKKLSENL